MFSVYKKEGHIEAIDLLKLFALLLVIFGHSIIKCVADWSSGPIYNFVWLTQMPLFMFAAGFVNNKINKINCFFDYIKSEGKIALTLLIPCLSFLLINCAIFKTSVLDAFINFFKNPETNLWFLWVLFVIHSIFNLGILISNKIKFKLSIFIPFAVSTLFSVIVFVLMFVFGSKFNSQVLSVKLIAYYMPFYCFGNIFNLFIKSELSNKKVSDICLKIIVVLSFVILLFECFYFKSIYSFDDSNIKFLLIRIIGSVASIIVCVFVFGLLSKISLFKKASQLGKYSLQSYYLHIIILKFISWSSDVVLTQWLLCIGAFFLLVASVAVCLVVFYYIPFMNLILFGKSKSKYKFEEKLLAKR